MLELTVLTGSKGTDYRTVRPRYYTARKSTFINANSLILPLIFHKTPDAPYSGYATLPFFTIRSSLRDAAMQRRSASS